MESRANGRSRLISVTAVALIVASLWVITQLTGGAAHAEDEDFTPLEPTVHIGRAVELITGGGH